MNSLARGMFAVSLFLLIPSRAWSDCPTACATFVECCTPDLTPLPPHDFCSNTAASFDTSVFSDQSNPFSSGHCVDHLAYDVPSGEIYTSVGATLNGCSSSVSVDEDFTVSGPPGGTAVDFFAQLQVTRVMQFPAPAEYDLTARLSHGTDVAAWHVGTSDAFTPPFTITLTLPLHVVAGTAFRMNYFVQGIPDEGNATLLGIFSFTGLPSGASIRSCRGYSQDAVATQRTSWGRVKATYR